MTTSQLLLGHRLEDSPPLRIRDIKKPDQKRFWLSMSTVTNKLFLSSLPLLLSLG